MKILFLCHRFPFPPDHGGRIRSFHLLCHLAGRHQLTVASLLHPGDDPRVVDPIRERVSHLIVERVGRGAGVMQALWRLWQGGPPSFGFFDSRRLTARIADLVARERFDLVFVHSSSMAPYVESLSVPKVLDFCDMDSQKWKDYAARRSFALGWAYGLESRGLEREERRLAPHFDAVTVASAVELEALRQICGGRVGDIIPNGVDHVAFHPTDTKPVPDSVCFLGRMDYYPNIDAMLRFCDDVWPLVRQKRADAVLTIIGAEPPRSIRRLDGQRGVHVTGTVADVRPIALRAQVSVAPLAIARGTQNKILESMAMGIPVVATSVAAAGVDVVPGEHLFVADDPREFAAAILQLLADQSARTRLARAGRERVLSHHDWASAMRRVDEIVDRCVRRAGSPAF